GLGSRVQVVVAGADPRRLLLPLFLPVPSVAWRDREAEAEAGVDRRQRAQAPSRRQAPRGAGRLRTAAGRVGESEDAPDQIRPRWICFPRPWRLYSSVRAGGTGRPLRWTRPHGASARLEPRRLLRHL